MDVDKSLEARSLASIHRDEWYTIEQQGQFVRVRCRKLGYVKKGGGKRKKIYEFSRKSRFRVLQMLAKIEWEKVGESCFITLTYPDAQVHFDHQLRNYQRKQFWEWIEKTTGKQIPLVWRVEWKPRLSGACVGRVSPHLHILTFDGGALETEECRRKWMKVIGASEYTQVVAKPVPKGKAVAFYVSKYCGKVEPAGILDGVPYLAKTGRHWGWMRKPLLPLYPKGHEWPITDQEAATLRVRASAVLPWYDPTIDRGFTLLGDKAEKIWLLFVQSRLDNGGYLV
jgi:hypothetical protein